MKRRRQMSELREYIEETKKKQKNLLWPNLMENSRGVDELLFKGYANPTPVQRIGAWLFGLTYILIGFGFLGLAMNPEEDSRWVPYLLAGGLWAVGAWICYNGSRRRKSPGERKQNTKRS